MSNLNIIIEVNCVGDDNSSADCVGDERDDVNRGGDD